MSDNLPPEVVQQELEARFRIPTEVWTDVFKLLPRRVLVQQVAPVCYKFKEISNKNVKNVHVIENADKFTMKLDEDDSEANQQSEQLAGNQCQLASQFRLTYLRITEKNKLILRHCPDLFKGCRITLVFNEENKDSTLFLESLSLLKGAKPAEICVNQDVDRVDYWHHPTFQNCSRIDLSFESGVSADPMMNVFDWLHQQPNPNGVMDCDDGSAADQQVRCMIIQYGTCHKQHAPFINQCAEDIQRGREPADRRPFVLSYHSWCHDQFRHENNLTGETLVLDCVMDANGQPTRQYRLRRCLAEEEEAKGEEFYTGMFDGYHDGYERFNIDKKTTEVMIIG